MDSRVIKKRGPPLRLVVMAVSIAAIVFAFIVFAVWESSRGIREARMTGIIVSREFISKPEQQVTMSKDGLMSVRNVEGEFIITVEVPQKDGSKKPYKVWLPDKKSYEKSNIGDSFDVGPYLIRE